jgi:chromosome segregation ATPase
MSNAFTGRSEAVVPFAPAAKPAVSAGSNPIDDAGQSILGLLQRAASVAEENSKYALDLAQKLALQLQTAEQRTKELEADVRHYQERIKELEADVRHYQDQASRAKEWMSHISAEIEQKFLAAEHTARSPSSQPNGSRAYARRANVDNPL